MSLELVDQVQHTPRMCGIDGNPLEHLAQQQISSLLVCAFKDNSGDEVNEEASNGVGVTDQVENELYHLFFKISF